MIIVSFILLLIYVADKSGIAKRIVSGTSFTISYAHLGIDSMASLEKVERRTSKQDRGPESQSERKRSKDQHVNYMTCTMSRAMLLD